MTHWLPSEIAGLALIFQAAPSLESSDHGVEKNKVKDMKLSTAARFGRARSSAWLGLTVLLVALAAPSPRVEASTSSDAAEVSALDVQFQAAVKRNDAATMDRILADDYVLVTGSGKAYTKSDLLKDARSGSYIFEHQEDSEQTVRVWGNTAVVTAKLWEKGLHNGQPFDYTVWFSDTYVRTPAGWKYVFGQSSLPLPKAGS